MKVIPAMESIMINPSSEPYLESNLSSTQPSTAAAAPVRTVSADPSIKLLTVQNQNGQIVIQQPLKTISNGSNSIRNAVTLTKDSAIMKQKPVSANQPISISATKALLGDVVAVERAGSLQPQTPSNNIITKLIITKNSLPGLLQPYQTVLPSPNVPFTLTNGGSISTGSINNWQQGSSSVNQTATLAKGVISHTNLSPIKNVSTAIPGVSASKISTAINKISTSPLKPPTVFPVSITPNKQKISSDITALSCALNVLAQTGIDPLNSVSPSKVIIKQGPSPTGSSTFTLKAQPLQVVRAANPIQNMKLSQPSTNVHPAPVSSAESLKQIQVPGSRFHYVRLVPPTSNLESTKLGVKVNSEETAQVIQAPLSMQTTVATAVKTNQAKAALPVRHNTPLAPKPADISTISNTQHRIILPATSSSVNIPAAALSSLVNIQPAPSAPVNTINQLPTGTSFLSAANGNLQGIQSFALVPASYLTQFQQQLSQPQVAQAVTPPPPQAKQSRDFVPIASIDPAVTQYTVSRNIPSTNGLTLEATGARPRKPCNCTKSQCLKLYCDCFANGEFCQNCNCTNCANNLEHEEERSKAIKSCLDRNPQAFHPKIGKSRDTEGNRQHNKGCNCKRSWCLKNYCECYEAKIMCSSYCKCIGCKNFEDSSERKTLMHLANAAEVRVQQQTAAKTKLSSQISCVPSRPPTSSASGERLPFALITSDVAEATSACLLAQAEEAERMKMPPVVQERMIIEEFGRCLMQIIESANKTQAASSMA